MGNERDFTMDEKQGNLDRDISILYQIIEFGTKTLSYYTLKDKSFLRPHEYSCGFFVFIKIIIKKYLIEYL
jgi:hypothetical protein